MKWEVNQATGKDSDLAMDFFLGFLILSDFNLQGFSCQFDLIFGDGCG
jgi:hypothetical protein